MTASRLPQQVLQLLEEHGTLTALEITRLTGEDRRLVGDTIGRMAKALRTMPKRIYIDHYVRDVEGARKYLRASYAIGDKPDAPKMRPISRAEIQRGSGARRRRKLQTNFVFNLGVGINRLSAAKSEAVRSAT